MTRLTYMTIPVANLHECSLVPSSLYSVNITTPYIHYIANEPLSWNR